MVSVYRGFNFGNGADDYNSFTDLLILKKFLLYKKRIPLLNQ
jgi:hypothetical protein